jgi:hypothetical protein
VLDRVVYTGDLSTHDSIVLIDASKALAAMVLRRELQTEVTT